MIGRMVTKPMSRRLQALLFVSVALYCIPGAANSPAAGSCGQVADLALPSGQVIKAEEVPAGGFLPEPGPRGVTSPIFSILPAFCRVSARLAPTADSNIRIEVWLPAQGWNGRFVAVGNGGFQSHFDYRALAQGLSAGYAIAGSNAAHDTQDGSFAIDHPEKLIDWGHRGIHEMTVAAKKIIAAHYGEEARYSYWNSCSTGGRQGLNAAERYPEDFDGLAIGAPANPMTRLQLGSIWNNLAVNRTSDSFIPREGWQAIHAAVLAACDAADGLADGLINNPLACRFEPEVLACERQDTGFCLKPDQIAALEAIYQGARNPRTDEQIYPGWAPGFEGGMPGPTAREVPQQDAIDTFRVIFNDPDWDYRSVSFDDVVTRSDERGNATINAADPARLADLFAHGGKILLYHGWNDVGISALGSLDYYTRAVAANGGEEAASRNIRLFLAPGMSHCQGGDGPNQFDKLAVLSAWVEQGRAPDRIDAAHYNSAGEIDRTRPLCPFPRLATYDGTGSIDDAANFTCEPPTNPQTSSAVRGRAVLGASHMRTVSGAGSTITT